MKSDHQVPKRGQHYSESTVEESTQASQRGTSKILRGMNALYITAT